MKSLVLTILVLTPPAFAANSTEIATEAINALGLDLVRTSAAKDDNTLLSPYSIQSALAMTFTGADGQTKAEMARVLHYPAEENTVHPSFTALRAALDAVMQNSRQASTNAAKRGGKMDPITLTTANRLFGQTGYEFRQPFLDKLKQNYAAPLETLDFAANSSAATRHINEWVENQTQDRIQDLIPTGALNEFTRLVLVNAIYFKAPWATPFNEQATKPETFHLGVANLASVPTMRTKQSLGYAKRGDYAAVTIPYSGGELQFLILLPDKVEGLESLAKDLTAVALVQNSKLPFQELVLFLPKFKPQSTVLSLGRELRALGMNSAFDQPPGSANFEGMVAGRKDNSLFLSEVFHQAFMNLDEKGTEAAAATAAVMAPTSMIGKPTKPIEVHVDRPFLFAIQHRASGACLFLGRVCDPR